MLLSTKLIPLRDGSCVCRLAKIFCIIFVAGHVGSQNMKYAMAKGIIYSLSMENVATVLAVLMYTFQ